MALTAPKPRVRQTSTTTGTGTYNLDATIPDAYLGFVAEIGDTNTCHVLVTDSASNGWEWGTYTVGDATPDTIARTTVKRSTNGNAAVNWSAGTRTLSVIWPPDVTEMLALLGVEAGAGTDNSVTLAKMAAGTDGNIISYDASGDPVAVATGDDGQVLTSAGAGQPPAFETAGGGATQEFFSPVTFVSGGATMIQTANFGPGAQANSDNDRGHVAFIVPADFSSIDELVFIVIPDVTNGASWWKTSVGFGAAGEAPDAHYSSSSVYYNVTEDVLYEVDLSGVFSAIVAGDQCGIQIYMNGAGGDVTFLGVRFKY